MDPIANINEQRLIAKAILKAPAAVDVSDYQGEDDFANAERLAELVLELHEWRCKGGFDPYSCQPGASMGDATPPNPTETSPRSGPVSHPGAEDESPRFAGS